MMNDAVKRFHCLAPLCVGLVVEQDPLLARVRVRFPDHDAMNSYWLALVVPKTQDDKAYWIPDIGEQVVCLMDANLEAGVVLGAIYSTADTVPVTSPDKCHLSFRDQTAIEYDRAAHALSVVLATGATMRISANATTLEFDGSGNVNITAAGKINLGGNALKGVARLGDEVTVNDPQSGSITGTITSASGNVFVE